MKVAVSSTGKNLSSRMAEIFGRCPYFVIAEIENKKIKGVETIENINRNQAGGAGISVAQMIVEKGASVVITENIGPRALDVLKQFKVDVFNGSGSVKENIQRFIEGKLKKL